MLHWFLTLPFYCPQLGEGAAHSQVLQGQKPGGMREQSIGLCLLLALLLFIIALRGCCICPRRGVTEMHNPPWEAAVPSSGTSTRSNKLQPDMSCAPLGPEPMHLAQETG